MIPSSVSLSLGGVTRIAFAIGVLALSIVASGCLGGSPNGTPQTTQQPTETATPDKSHPNLSSQLAELAAADDPAAYAREHDVTYRNGSVKVLIDLVENRTIPGSYGLEVVSRHESRVVAWAPVEQLVPLSNHENVSFVRRPAEPQTYALDQ